MNKRLQLVLLFTATHFSIAALSAEGADNSGFSYAEKGLQYQSADGNNFLWFGVRVQTRYSNTAVERDQLPEEAIENEAELKVNRGRLKLGGHLITPKLQIYSEYDFVDARLLDYRLTYSFSDWLNIRIGQWKSEYNRERIDSSGAQQFVERSVVTPWFTIDRQEGLMVSGRVGAETGFDSSYWVGRLSGAGRGGDRSNAEGLWMGRYQWNFTRRVLGFSQSDIAKRTEPAGSIAVAMMSGESAYTSFSSAGGGQLPGYIEGSSDQYKIQQAHIETAWQHRGFSWQQEFHWKKIQNQLNGTQRHLRGGYAQVGMFFSEVWSTVPAPLEVAIRYAAVEPDERFNNNYEREVTLAANWFFSGHRNKLTVDLSRVERQEILTKESNNRVRLQWDLSF